MNNSIEFNNYYDVLSKKKTTIKLKKEVSQTPKGFECVKCKKKYIPNNAYQFKNDEYSYNKTKYCSYDCSEEKKYIRCRNCRCMFHRDYGYDMAGCDEPEYCSRYCERMFER